MGIFLRIRSAGHFSLASGETLDLSEYVVVTPTNISRRILMESRSTDCGTLVRRTVQAATQGLRPESFARFDLHSMFNKLNYQALKGIADVHLDKSLVPINSLGRPSALRHASLSTFKGKATPNVSVPSMHTRSQNDRISNPCQDSSFNF
jgi:hypothetical protein